MNETDSKQQIIDDEHLRLLSIFHYISGALTLVAALFLGLYVLFFMFILNSQNFSRNLGPGFNPDFPHDIIPIIATIIFIVFSFVLLFGIFQIVSGRMLKQRKLRWLSFTVAIINLISIPYGTILGIFTIIVLGRESVSAQYEQSAQ